MKETVKMSRAVGQLEKMYNKINMDKFNGELPVPIITVQSKKGTWGHCSVSKIWKRKEDNTYEMNISAECVGKEIEEIIDTLIHEMIHLYCREKGIKEVSRGGVYHNSKFKELAEEKGLITFKTEKYGYNTKGIGNNKLIEYALSNDWTEIKIGREDIINNFRIPPVHIGTGENTPIKQPSSTRKYQCPYCKNSVRATKVVNIICGDCMQKMEIVK